MMKRIIAMIAASISCMIMLAQDLQFNQCADARTLRNESLPRWDKMLDDMFAEMKAKGIKRLIVDAQYNNGGSSMFCDELLIRLCPFEMMTLVRDNHLGTIVGTNSTFSPSHYGEVLPYRLPNTGVIGTISCKFFARPDKEHIDDKTLVPDVAIDLTDKVKAFDAINRLFD